MNEAAKNEIRRLADAELEEVKKEFPEFSSCYEAYAAAKAKTEEAWNEAQALERAGGLLGNKGSEGAAAAIDMANMAFSLQPQ